MKFLLLGVILFSFSGKEKKCDCDHIFSFNESKLVFEGKVLEIKRIEEPFIIYEILFKVNKVIKGKIKTNTIKVNAPCLEESCCGIPFMIDSVYKVYTIERNNMVYTNICTATYKIGAKNGLYN